MKDIRVHWIRWREEWEKKLLSNEIHFLRSVADLHAATAHRMSTMDASYRESLQHQHGEFDRAMREGMEEVQRKLWADLERIRLEYEQLIHKELRVIRQKASARCGVCSGRRPLHSAAPSSTTRALPTIFAALKNT